MVRLEPGFEKHHLPERHKEFVAWIGIMGTSSFMIWSENIASVNIGKLQTAVIEEGDTASFEIYPMMDGVYVISKNHEMLEEFVGNLFHRFSSLIIQRHENDDESKVEHAPILRAGIAYGGVTHGYELESKIARHRLSNSILLGQGVVLAHQSEQKAPPFGIRVHKSGHRSKEDTDVRWWNSEKQAKDLKEALNEYYQFHLGRSMPPYPDDKIRQHRKKMEDYLPGESKLSKQKEKYPIRQ